ncbi:MAG TPA: hypothetical protein VFF52_12010 [Isosphaeraceae bacterium]|nr:hypothetical protein [Isosphaeraceae bacterium]
MPATAEEKTTIQQFEVRLGKIDLSLKIIGAAVVFAATSFGYAAYQAGRIVTSVDAMKESLAEFKADMKQSLAELKADFKARDKQHADSLDRIEKALAQNRPGQRTE